MITIAGLKELEKNSLLPLAEIMENAGLAVSEEINARSDLKNKKIIIFAWHGNNSGDGFVAAHHLSKKADVNIFFLGKEKKLTDLARQKYERVKRLITKDLDKKEIQEADILIDAMLGTGVKGEIQEPLASAIDLFNSSFASKVSIDVPTGINPDTGEKANKFINPDLIITMHDMKPGLLQFKEKVIVKDVGLKQRK